MPELIAISAHGKDVTQAGGVCLTCKNPYAPNLEKETVSLMIRSGYATATTATLIERVHAISR